MIWFSIFCLIAGASWGWAFYQAVIYQDKFWAIMWAVQFAMWQADEIYNSEIIRGFIKGLS
jgi:hypothetical protein